MSLSACAGRSRAYRDANVAVVVGPTTGGGLMAQEVGRQLGVRCMIAEPASQGGRELRRGFVLHPGERVLVVDDVTTTGLACAKHGMYYRLTEREILGVEVLIDRSNGEAGKQFSAPFQALFSVTARSYDPADCPLCREGQPE